MTSSEQTAHAGARQGDLACFEVNGNVLAIDVLQIREIVRWQEVTPLPQAPALIEGVIDMRERVIPVVDLGRALGGAAIERTARARIVVLEVDGLLLGLRVGAAIDVLSLESQTVEPPPQLAMQAGYDAVRAVVRRPGASPVLVISLDHLLENIYRSALPAPAVGNVA